MRAGRRPIPPGAPGHPREKGSSREPPRGGPDRKGRGPSGPEGGRFPAGGPGRDGPEGGRGRRQAATLAYEDELILAYDKPARLPVIAPDGSRARCLLDIATERVRQHNPKGRAAVVHRIDRDTSGIVVFAMNAAVKRLLMSGWEEIVAERRYVALVKGRMEAEEGVLDSYLVEDGKLFVRVAGPREKGAKRAVSKWRVLAEGKGSSLVEIFLETGRKHQIRVQFAAAGHPVLGDPRYGRSGRDGSARRGAAEGRLFLHAAAIELRLPESAQPIRIESPVPPEFRRELNAPHAGACVSRPEARSAAHSRRGAPRAKKPSSRT